MPCQVMDGDAAQRSRFDTGLMPRTAEQGLQMPRPRPTLKGQEMPDTMYVEIREYDDGWPDGRVVSRLGPMPDRKAEKVDRRLNINLDHDRFFTTLVIAR